jgi:hypothetical protein
LIYINKKWALPKPLPIVASENSLINHEITLFLGFKSDRLIVENNVMFFFPGFLGFHECNIRTRTLVSGEVAKLPKIDVKRNYVNVV